MTQVINIHWQESNQAKAAIWQSAANNKPPKKIQVIDDTLKADAAYKLVCEGTALLWRGDFQNAKHMAQAISRRIDNRDLKPKARNKRNKAEKAGLEVQPKDLFHLYRKGQIERARTLGMLLVELTADYRLPYHRAPDIAAACEHAYGKSVSHQSCLVSLREILGIIGAYEWHKKGVAIAPLAANITPSYGVYSPVRGEYLTLVNTAPLNQVEVAFDIGTGTGVIAAILAKRGVKKIIATDLASRALVCAKHNIQKLGYANQVQILSADLFPPVSAGLADLIVCNPPWLPAKANSAIEQAVYDPDSQMLKGFLAEVKNYLAINGEAWLILSDFATHLALRSADELQQWIVDAGLTVVEKLDIAPQHGKASNPADPLHQARSKEVTSLYRLRVV
ncbi:MAG: class I SAM-dependent methyltransferase [Methylophilaceae bacterium]|nr:class I SAM-dependent methyltransferase [Methylophilaceae bacterium]MDG1445804.1 class I SAM-dependent methyltransferase [Methylophilaceae bacterium]